MKTTSILQIILGLLTAVTACFLANFKGYVYVPEGMSLSPPPTILIELTLSILSLVILLLSFRQLREGVTGADFQVFFGEVAVLLSVFLFGRAAALHYGERSYVYMLAYVIMVAGLLVSIVGIIQLKSKENNPKIMRTTKS
jgi:hypothetical protein